MNLIDVLKGVFSKMIAPKSLENVIHVSPTISNQMKNAIELWEAMYKDESPWLFNDLEGNVKSLNLASLISSEKARTATIEMELKVTGDSEKAKFIKDNLNKLRADLRENLEYGIALGGFVIKPYITMGPDGKYKVEFNYTKATDFFPLSFSADGKVTEAAFIDRIITKDYIYSKVEYHKLVGTTLYVSNYAFENRVKTAGVVTNALNGELGVAIPLTNIPEWSNITPEVQIEGAETMLFAYFKMPEANTIDLDSPLGVSGFSRAVDLIKEADFLYSDLLWEFEGSQLAVDVDRTATNYMYDSSGKQIEVLPKLQRRLFRSTMDLGDDNAYNVFSPTIRDASILNGLNNQLMRIEDVCAISRGTLSVVGTSEARTATELKILKQRSYSANSDIQQELQRTIENVVNILDKYCELYEICPDGSYEVAYKWDDSIIVDKDSERQQDLLEVNNGLMSKVEYRMKWYGETEQQALESLKTIDDERAAAMETTQSITAKYSNQNSGTAPTEKSKEADKKQRANESNETTTKDQKAQR